MQLTTEGLQIVQVDADHAMGIWGEVILTVWRRRTQLAAVEELQRNLHALGSRFPGGTATISVIEPTAVPPENDVRKALSAVLTIPRLQCSCLVYEGTGFQAATVRGVVTAITMIKTHPVPHVVHPSVKEGVEWSARMMGKAWTATKVLDLIRAIEELRGRISRAPGG
jgi:hypothetical protein